MADEDDFNTRVIVEFRANHGRVGGRLAGAPLLLLHTTGARTATHRINPVMYMPDDGRYLIFAAKAGSDRHPGWYYNLLAHPDAQIEIGDRVLDVHATELYGSERDDRHAKQVSCYPIFAAYQRGTRRTVPVIALIPINPEPAKTPVRSWEPQPRQGPLPRDAC